MSVFWGRRLPPDQQRWASELGWTFRLYGFTLGWTFIGFVRREPSREGDGREEGP